MATTVRSRVPEPPDGFVSSLTRLAQLEVELGRAELRGIARSVAIAGAAAAGGAVVLAASLVVLLAAALAPLVGARWEHLGLAGGASFAAAAAAVLWGVARLRALDWPRLTLASLEENWRWLGAQLRSRLTLR